jgi:Ran GTPase-activating protein (RanGAP) involved in mRNA processing and transport
VSEDDPRKRSKHVGYHQQQIKTNVDTVVSTLFLFDYLLCDCPKLYLFMNKMQPFGLSTYQWVQLIGFIHSVFNSEHVKLYCTDYSHEAGDRIVQSVMRRKVCRFNLSAS